MRCSNILAAVAATLIVGTAAAATEKPKQPKQRKICRVIEVSGRVTPQRICRKVEPAEKPDKSEQSARETDEAKGRSD